jgi:hypothetical protein
MFSTWLKLEFHRASNGTGPTSKFLLFDGNRRHEWASRICQGVVSPSVGPLARVPCWSPLGLRQGDLHAPNSLLFSSCHHFRVWILLRFNLSSNSVAVHRFMRPHLIIKSVLARFCSFGALDHQRRLLHQSSLPYLSEDQDSTSYQVLSVIRLPIRYTHVPLDLFCFYPIVHKKAKKLYSFQPTTLARPFAQFSFGVRSSKFVS